MELDDTAEFLNDLQPKRNRKRVSEQLPPIKLVCWRFNFKRLVEKSGGLFHDVALCIEGVRADNGTHWSTSEIHELIDSRHVKTKSSVYELVGKMERPLSLDRGFPHELIDKFANGFPDDWYEELRKFIDFGRRELQNHQNSQQPVVQFEASDSNESTRKRSQDFDDSPPLEKRRLSQRFQDDDDQSFDFAWPPDFDLPERLSEVDDEPQTSGIEPVNKDSLQVDSREHTPTPDPFETPRRLTRSATRLQNSQKTLTPVTPPNRPKRGRKFKRDSDFFTPQTPELNRSKRGRLLKPRLAFGERIVYNSKGEAIEARTSTTTTHLTNKNSKALKAIANGLHLQKADTPKQTERRLQSVYQPKKPKRRESQSKSALRKLLEYKSDSDHEEATPLAARKPQLGRRVVESDDDEESDSIASRTRQRTKRQPNEAKRRAADTKTLKRNVRQSTGKKRWGEKEKADLKTGFNLFNPIEEEDWNRLVEILPIDWTLEEVKAQAKVMRLKPVILNNQKHIRKSTDLLDRIKRLMVSGKMPAKGTLKREELEDAIEELVSKQNFVDTANDQLQDSLDDDEFLDEALRNYGLDDSICVRNGRTFTPSRRMFIPKPVFMNSGSSSMMAAQTVGDEFVLPNRDKEMRFRRQYRANQYNKRYGRQQKREDDENESNATVLDVSIMSISFQFRHC
ncbi:hypothetical protein M3Y95_01253000 [Aphelenchoides besseyi]|nr:hypothetical protein M3Y95_01253000 [Aphelenchoides besseyi]